MKRDFLAWQQPTLSDIAKGGLFTDGDWIESKDQDPAGSVRLTQLADIGVGVFRDRSDRWLREDQAASLGCTFLQPDDILIARMPEPIGRACIVPPDIGRAVTAVDVAVLRPPKHTVEPRYLMWAINSHGFHRDVVALQSGTTRKRISRRNLASLTVPLPPLHEQRQIVDVLEDLLSRLDAASADLNTAARRVTAHRAAALAASREGTDHGLAEIAVIQGGIQKQQKRAPRLNPYPFLRVANVTAQGLDLGEVHNVELFPGELERFRLEAGDLLVVEGNGSPTQIGRAALWDGSIDNCVHQNHLIRVRSLPGLLPGYLATVWNSPPIRHALTDLASSSSGLYTLSVGKLSSLRIPVPSLERQMEIVQSIAETQETENRLTDAIRTAELRVGRLRKAVLAAALAGRLDGSHSDMSRLEELAGV